MYASATTLPGGARDKLHGLLVEDRSGVHRGLLVCGDRSAGLSVAGAEGEDSKTY